MYILKCRVTYRATMSMQHAQQRYNSVKFRNVTSVKKFPAQGRLFSFDEDDEEDAVEKEVEDSGAGDTKKSYEDRIEEKGREIAAIIQKIAKPFPGSSLSVVWGYLNKTLRLKRR